MDILERIKNVIVKNLVEVKLGTNRPAEKSGETGDREQGEGSGANRGRKSLKAKTKEIAKRWKAERRPEDPKSFRNPPGTENNELDEAKKGRCWTGYKPTPGKKPYSKGSCMKESIKKKVIDALLEATPAWQRKEGKNPKGGLNAKGIASYRRENPGSKLQAAVTEKNPKGKRAKRRSSYCSRSGGQQRKHGIDCSKTPDKPICQARRRWRC